MGPETTKLFILSVRLKRTGSIVISIRRPGFRSGGSRSPRHSNLSIPKNRLERLLPAFCRHSIRDNVRYWSKADIVLLHCICLLLAQSGHRLLHCTCPLLSRNGSSLAAFSYCAALLFPYRRWCRS